MCKHQNESTRAHRDCVFTPPDAIILLSCFHVENFGMSTIWVKRINEEIDG